VATELESSTQRDAPPATGTPERWLVPLAFAAVYLIWGSTYLGIAIAIETAPPFLMAGARFLCAGRPLYLWLRLRGVPAPDRRHVVFVAGAGSPG